MDIQGAQYPLSWFLDGFGKPASLEIGAKMPYFETFIISFLAQASGFHDSYVLVCEANCGFL